MSSGKIRSKFWQALAMTTTVVNVALSLTFFPLVPLLGWLNYGHAGSAAWMPDWALLTLLPAIYYLYWHYGYVFFLPALTASIVFFRNARSRLSIALAAANGASLVSYAAVRIALAALGIRPDSV